MIRQALIRPGVYWHILPTYGEAKDSVWRDPSMLFNIIPKDLVIKKNEQELVVYLRSGPKGDKISIYQLKGSDQPDSLRGPNPVGVIFDEWDTQKAEAWGIIEPILRANGGWAWFIGTPRGKGKLYDLYNRGQSGHKEWQSYLLKSSTSGIIAADQLEEAKKSMSQALFNQEFECEFLEGEGSVFRGVRAVMTATPKQPIPNHVYVMGVDLAKVTDWTVIRVYDRDNNEMVYSDRFQKLEWPFQRSKIVAISRHYNNALTMLDATGLGDPIADDLLRANVPVEPIKITEPLKKELIEKLSIYIEQRKIRMIPTEEAMMEYDNFSYEIGLTGKIRYGARQGYHDDIVLADALAVYGLFPVVREEEVRQPTPTQVALARRSRKMEDGQEDGAWNEWSQE